MQALETLEKCLNWTINFKGTWNVREKYEIRESAWKVKIKLKLMFKHKRRCCQINVITCSEIAMHTTAILFWKCNVIFPTWIRDVFLQYALEDFAGTIYFRMFLVCSGHSGIIKGTSCFCVIAKSLAISFNSILERSLNSLNSVPRNPARQKRDEHCFRKCVGGGGGVISPHTSHLVHPCVTLWVTWKNAQVVACLQTSCCKSVASALLVLSCWNNFITSF